MRLTNYVIVECKKFLANYFINYSIFIQESKAQNTVLPGLFILYQLEYII